MRSLGEVMDAIEEWLSELSFDKKSMKIAFYTGVLVPSAICFVIVISIAYAGTNSPFDLFQCGNFAFSYAGKPGGIECNVVPIERDRTGIG